MAFRTSTVQVSSRKKKGERNILHYLRWVTSEYLCQKNVMCAAAVAGAAAATRAAAAAAAAWGLFRVG